MKKNLKKVKPGRKGMTLEEKVFAAYRAVINDYINSPGLRRNVLSIYILI